MYLTTRVNGNDQKHIIAKGVQSKVVSDFLDVIVLRRLLETDEPTNTYALNLQVKKDYGVILADGIYYAMFHSMEQRGLIVSNQETGTKGQPKRNYALTPKGKRLIQTVLETQDQGNAQRSDKLPAFPHLRRRVARLFDNKR